MRAKKAAKGSKATLSSKQELFAIKNSMYRLKETEEREALVCPCPANPFNIQCRVCTAFAHDGICKHCLALTHMLMARDDRRDERDPKCNIRLMAMRLSVGKRACAPAKATKALVPQPQPQPADAGGDSSDEEQDLATAILAGQAW